MCLILLNINILIIIVVMPSCRLTWPWLKVWPLLLSYIDWSLFCGLEICGLFTSCVYIMFNISFYGFASTGFFFLVFVSYCLLKYCRTGESFCSIFVSRELSPLSLCQPYAFVFYLFDFVLVLFSLFIFLLSHSWVCF